MGIGRVVQGMGIPLKFALAGMVISSAASAAEIAVIPDYDHGSRVEIESQLRELRHLKERAPHLDCLFVEVDRSVNASLEAYQLGRASYYASVQIWINQMENYSGYDFRNVIPAYFLEEAKGLGLRVFGIDVDLRSSSGQILLQALRAYYNGPGLGADAGRNFVQVGVIERNEQMARNARSEYANRHCRAAALIVGSSHLEERVGGIPSRPLLPLLEQAGFSLIQD